MEPPCDVKALYDYKSEHDDDLNFHVGQVIHVSAIEDEEWLTGSYIDADGSSLSGIFPKNFVELIEAPKAPVRPSRTSAKQATAPVDEAEDVRHAESNSTSTLPQASPPKSTIQLKGEHEEHAISESRSTTTDTNPENTAEPNMEAESKVLPNTGPTEQDATPVKPEFASTELTTSKSQAPVEALSERVQTATDKPVKSNAFRDRIAAFNKQGAAPVAPKPMAKPSLAKKPFVAPPPSKDALVDTKPRHGPTTQKRPDATDVMPVAAKDEVASATAREPVMVGSLKDRIAALQAEQQQAAAKRAAASQRIEQEATDPAAALEPRPKDEQEVSRGPIHDDENEQEELASASTSREELKRTMSIPVVPAAPIEVDNESLIDDEFQSPKSPPMLARQDTHRSIESIHPQNTGASIQSKRSIQAVMSPRLPPTKTFPSAIEEPSELATEPDTVPLESTSAISKEIEMEEPEEAIDEEELRKQRLRERMAKMSGGMGMGMHMALGFGGPTTGARAPIPKSNPASTRSDASVAADRDIPVQQAPVPMPGMPIEPLPGSHDTHESNPNITESSQDGGAVLISEKDSAAATRVPGPSSAIAIPIPETTPIEQISRAGAALSLNDEPSKGVENLSTPEPTRAVPPPIPGGRPVTNPVSIAIESQAQTPVAGAVPSMAPSPIVSVEHSMRSPPPPIPQTNARASLEFIRNPHPPPIPTVSVPDRPSVDVVRSPPPIPSSSIPTRPSIEAPRSPPPMPISTIPSRPSIDTARGPPPVPSTHVVADINPASNTPSAETPSSTPGGSQRMSYFGPVSSSSTYRPSIDSTRRSIDQARSSIDVPSRTNSERVDAPIRPPPPPGAPSSRAPAPPNPVISPPSRSAPTFDTRGAQQASRQSMDQPQYPRSYESLSIPPQAMPSENERAGYEADDDDTDAYSEGTHLAQESATTLSGFDTQPQASEKAKKKGIKGLFKRKDK